MMRMNSRLLRLLVPVAVFLSLACAPCGLFSRDMPTPPHPLPVSTEAAGQLESRLRQNLQGQPGQPFTLRMTDEEVTSLVAIELSKYDESPVANPVIWFTKGKIYATGTLVNVLPIQTEFFLAANARVEDGQVAITMEEVSAGALPIPAGLLDTFSQSLNETVQEAQTDVEVTDLEILEGEMVIQGITK